MTTKGAKAVELHRAGKTDREIATEIRSTPRAVAVMLSVARRRGFLPPLARPPVVPTASKTPFVEPPEVIQELLSRGPWVPKLQVTLQHAATYGSSFSLGRHVFSAEEIKAHPVLACADGKCRWPVESKFCMAPAKANSPYCAEHAARSVQPRTPKEIAK